jgi:methylenetetrahydrofolate dehydrogenase (NADP+) / methenyltetrahydrofolate cyclohydrolase
VAISRKIREECRNRVELLKLKSGARPGLAVILVGENPASVLYVRNKLKACEEIGIRSYRFDFPVSVDQAAVVERIKALNEDPNVHGILVQLPLPPSFDLMGTSKNTPGQTRANQIRFYGGKI